LSTKPKDHGGDVWGAARQLGRPVEEILDFSASINPLGIPAEVLRAAREALPLSIHYPEPDAASLRRELSLYHALPEANILPGNGSTELIHLFARTLRPRRVLMVTPAFSEYHKALRQNNAFIDPFPLDSADAFRLDPEALLHNVSAQTDLVLLANPGNPTGAGIAPEVIEALARGVREQAVVAVDEAFVDFCPERSVIERVLAHGNLFVFRSLTKFYAIPGLRAGYLAGPATGIGRLERASSPWAFSAPSLAAARACLAQDSYRCITLETIPKLRSRLAAGLTSLGITVFSSAANFLLLRLENGPSAPQVTGALREQGILVRDCSNFPPLTDRYLRVAVRSEEDNERLLCEMKKLLS
jgi:threonine-phosphate decarboxylase